MTQEYFPEGWTKDKTFVIHYNYTELYYMMKIEPALPYNGIPIKIDGHSVTTFNNLYFGSISNTSFVATSNLSLFIKFIKQHKISIEQLYYSDEIGQIIDLLDEIDIVLNEDLCHNA